MQDKELRKLRRGDLIEIIYEYQVKEQNMLKENQELRDQLASRELKIKTCGSIAEAALSLNGVFEAAQKAADQYLEAMQGAKARADAIVAEARSQAAKIVAEARKSGQSILNDACEQTPECIQKEEAWQAVRRLEEDSLLWKPR